MSDSKKTEKFIVADHFTTINSKIKFSYISKGFNFNFLTKTEEEIILPRLHHDLCCRTLDSEILNDIGREVETIVTLSGIYELLKLQPNCEAGVLLTNNDHVNIFYVCDIFGILRAVYVGRCDDGWFVDSNTVGYSDWWRAGDRVFSR